MSDSDYYRLLGVNQTATTAEIKKAFRVKAHELHPDKGGSKGDFERLKVAYETLIDSKKRADYDKSLPVVSFDVSREKWRMYDPFDDPLYDKRKFFQPSHPNIEGMERHERAIDRHCHKCYGMGSLTRLVNPDEGYFGIQERLCGCQLMED